MQKPFANHLAQTVEVDRETVLPKGLSLAGEQCLKRRSERPPGSSHSGVLHCHPIGSGPKQVLSAHLQG